MKFRGPIKLEEAGGASRKIFSKIVKLVSAGEITLNENMILEEMAKVFLSLEDEKPTPESLFEAEAAENKYRTSISAMISYYTMMIIRRQSIRTLQIII